MQCDANDAVIYGPAPAVMYLTRPVATAPTEQLQAYIEACQAADDELRDAQFPHCGSALNHRPLDSELKTILLAHSLHPDSVHTGACTNSIATGVTTGRLTRISTTISTTLSSTTRTVSSPAPATAMQRSKTATDLGALAQAAGAAIRTAPVGKRRFSKQHPSAKHNNSQPTHRPIAISTTSHPTLVDRRAT